MQESGQKEKKMNPDIKPEILSKEMVKPSSPTPDHKRIHPLCFFEQIFRADYMPNIFFYSDDQAAQDSPTQVAHKSFMLKQSLSTALSRYYPLAGRIKDSVTIDCNDEGVEFLEAQSKCNLSDILKYPSPETMASLIPEGLRSKDPLLSSLLIVQVTYFGCGGMALTLCISHKVTDMAGQCSFMSNWAAMARRSAKDEITPLFNLGFLYPSIELSTQPYELLEKVNCTFRRLVFDASNIAKLKAVVANKVQNPTRVELVTALIFKSAISAARSVSGSSKPAILLQAINLRSRMTPPVSKSSMGCFSWNFAASIRKESEIELAQLVSAFRQEKTEFCNNLKRYGREELYSFILERPSAIEVDKISKFDMYICSSWCGFPIYEVDFGWGKPVWVTPPEINARNIYAMMDTRKGDGIEAFVSLEEQEMAVFESDEELLAFAKVSPSVVDSQYTSGKEIASPQSRM